MVARTLVDENVKAGRRLVEALDNELSIQAALWLYSPEVDRWRLMLAVRELETTGRRQVYAQINRILSQLQGAGLPSLEDVTVVSPRDKLIGVIGSVIRTGHELQEIRFTGNSVNNVYIDDALIYRMDAASS